jgi:beta-lactamase class D
MPVSHGDTKLQRHIEPSQIRIAFPSATRKIVNRVFGLDDGAQNASHARLRHGPGFQSAARHESTADRGKHNRVEEGAEFFVVRTIDEN